MPASPAPSAPTSLATSALGEGLPRFLSYALAYSLHIGLRTPDDFLRHFPPSDLMGALAADDDLRSLLLERTTGMKRAIAVHKSLKSAAADLTLSLEHREADPATVVELIDSDRIVAHVAADRVWKFLAEDKFWLLDQGQAERFEVARQFVSFLLMTAMSEGLVTTAELVERITPETLALCLPRTALAPLFTLALAGNDEGGLDADAVLAAAPPAMLAQHVPLGHLWRTIFVDRIACILDLASSSAAHSSARPSGRDDDGIAPPYEELDVDIDGVIETLSDVPDIAEITTVSRPRAKANPRTNPQPLKPAK